MLKGIAASAGIGIGKAVLIRHETIEVEKRTVLYLEEEKQRFLDAVERFIADLEQARELVEQNVGPSEAAILGAQIAIVRDPELTKEVLRTIERQQVNAEYAINLICNGYIALFSNLEDELISARSADFQDIRDRMLRILLGIQEFDISTVPAGSIIIAEDIPPSQASGIDSERIVGIVTRKGTKFSHISIIARALQLPAVVSVDQLFDVLEGGETLIIDGYSGYISVNPNSTVQQEYREMRQEEEKQHLSLLTYRDRPTITADGKVIQLESNLAVLQELGGIRENNADGIGLFRTEFLFMDRMAPPTEQEQYQFYAKVVEGMGGKPVVIRTLDSGGDKAIPYLHEKEENPFLGHRAIRYCLHHPQLFKMQLAAILRAAALGNVHLMLPMISSITELREARALIRETAEELEARGEEFCADIPVGIMIETPAAVFCAEDLAREADFFSIGTNDLTQYILAVDRSNGNVAPLYSPMHPAVLRAVAVVIRAAHSAGIRVSICGESGSDPLLAPFYIGAGVDALSVNSGALLQVRGVVDKTAYGIWESRVPEILALHTPDEVRRYLAGKMEVNA